MADRGSKILSVLFYVVLFSVSLLIFDSITLSIGIVAGLFALHHFSTKQAGRF